MREIKFRGKRIDNGEWVYGSLLLIENLAYVYNGDSCPSEVNFEYEFIAVDPATVGQYTGLKDKKGKEIFEGDILQEVATGQVVAIEYTDFQWGFIYTRNNVGYVWPNHPENFVVIGNIHDNPELLK